MTVELKTLEDLMEFGAVLEIRSTVDDSLKARYTPPYPAVTKVGLKHEAIKWIKALSDVDDYCMPNHPNHLQPCL